MKISDLTQYTIQEGSYGADNTYLQRYMQDETIDHYTFWWKFEEWIEEAHDNGDIDDQEYDQTIKVFDPDDPESFHKMPASIQEAFIEWMRNDGINYMMRHDPAEAPTWAHASYERRLPPDTWLIHFSDSSHDISQQGFTKGVSQVDKLGLTTYLSQTDRNYPGYNFAFQAGSRDVLQHSNGYGSEAVIFQHGGILIYHHGDKYNQVIFYGPGVDRRSLIYLTQEDGDWVVAVHPSKRRQYPNRSYVFRGNLQVVQEWVMANADAYRKIITGW